MLSAADDMRVVGESDDAESTRRVAAREAPDVIVLDVHMPGATGMALTRELRAQHPHTHILAISLFRDRMIVEAMLDAGALGYVCKDDLHASLLPAVRAVARGARYTSPDLRHSEGATQHPTDGSP